MEKPDNEHSASAPGLKKGRGPSQQKTAATRAALIDAGLAAFLEKGFASTSIGEVAKRAGLAKGTAYLHFSDKADLFAEVLREFLREAAGRQRPARPKPGEPTAAFLRRVFVPLLREIQAQDRFRVLYLVIAEGPRIPELSTVYRRLAVEPVLRMAGVYAARAVRRGELTAGALEHNPILLVAPMLVGAIWNNVFGQHDPLDVASLFDRHLDIIFGGPIAVKTS